MFYNFFLTLLIFINIYNYWLFCVLSCYKSASVPTVLHQLLLGQLSYCCPNRFIINTQSSWVGRSPQVEKISGRQRCDVLDRHWTNGAGGPVLVICAFSQFYGCYIFLDSYVKSITFHFFALFKDHRIILLENSGEKYLEVGVPSVWRTN